MPSKKVLVNRTGIYGSDGELPLGEVELDEGFADNLIERALVEPVQAEPEAEDKPKRKAKAE